MEKEACLADTMMVLKKMYMQLLQVSSTGLELFEKGLSDEELLGEIKLIVKKRKSLIKKIRRTADRVQAMETKLLEETKMLDSSLANHSQKYQEYLETKGEVIDLIRVIQVNNSRNRDLLLNTKMEISKKIGENRKIRTAVNSYQPKPIYYNASFFDQKK